MNRNCCMKQLYEAGFARDDASLYLDTHPCCEEALVYFKSCVEKYEAAKKSYADQYGPLLMDQVDDCSRWTWMNSPWPWEGGMR